MNRLIRVAVRMRHSSHRTASALVLMATGAICQVGFASSTVVHAQTGEVDVTRVEFVRDRVAAGRGGSPRVLEEGSYLIAPDGRYRLERIIDGVRHVEIVRPDEDKRVVLDLGARRAVVGSLSNLWSAPSSQPVPVPTPAIPSGLARTSQDFTPLGSKIVGGLTLEGTRDTTVMAGANNAPVVHTIEIWTYRFPNPRILPIVLEMRAETPDGVDERRITRVEVVQVPRETFDVPSSFSIVQADG